VQKMTEKKVSSPDVVRVVVGDTPPATALALLWGVQGREPAEIAARFQIDVAEVEAAILLHGHKYPHRPKRRRRRV